MVDLSERFPETPEGIKKAQEKAGPDGHWPEYVDWWGNSTNEVSPRLVVSEAIREDAEVSPDLIERVGLNAGKTAIVNINTTEEY